MKTLSGEARGSTNVGAARGRRVGASEICMSLCLETRGDPEGKPCGCVSDLDRTSLRFLRPGKPQSGTSNKYPYGMELKALESLAEAGAVGGLSWFRLLSCL